MSTLVVIRISNQNVRFWIHPESTTNLILFSEFVSPCFGFDFVFGTLLICGHSEKTKDKLSTYPKVFYQCGQDGGATKFGTVPTTIGQANIRSDRRTTNIR